MNIKREGRRRQKTNRLLKLENHGSTAESEKSKRVIRLGNAKVRLITRRRVGNHAAYEELVSRLSLLSSSPRNCAHSLIPRSGVDRFLARAAEYNPQTKANTNANGNRGEA